MAETMRGIDYLRSKLNNKRSRVLTRYRAYDMKNQMNDFMISTPPQLRGWASTFGWCAKAVDSLADRLIFREFRNDSFNLNEIYQRNNPDIIFDSAILSALIGSCSFICISADDNGYPRMKVIDGANATGEIDPTSGLLTEGYAVLERDDNGSAVLEAYFTSTYTLHIRTDKGKVTVNYTSHNAGYPLLVPIIHRPDASRPFGHSRISRACMSITESARRTVKRSEISAEFYSFPQKYGLGIDENVEIDKWTASMSAMMLFGNNESGEKPTVGQFQQQSMSPHIEQLRMFASLFAGETGLTLDDIGFPSDNPSSSDAIRAAHENLRLSARKAQRTFGSGFLNAGFTAACLRDKFPYDRSLLFQTKAVWEPVFEPDAATLSSIGDGAIKLNQAVPGYIDNINLRDMTGIDGNEESDGGIDDGSNS